MTAHRSRAMPQRLAIAASDAALERRFARAGDRALALARAGTLAPGEDAVTALAALVLGDPGPASSVLKAWAAGRAADAGAGGTGVVSLPLLAARHVAWTGDAALARQLGPRVLEAQTRMSELVRGPEADPGLMAVVAGLLRELAALTETTGDRATAAATDAQARSLLRAARAAPSDPPAPEYLIAVALGAFDPDPPPVPAAADFPESAMSLPDVAFACVQVWARLAGGHTGSAAHWEHLLTYLEKSASAATAPSPDVPDLIGEGAALAIVAGVFGLLGASPDAPKNRLRLRPHVPEAWNALEVRNLAMGDSRFDLRVRRQDGRRTYVIEQTAGAIPATIILEMLVSGPPVGSIEVDGRAAALDIRAFGPAFVIPVQLVTDDVRSVSIDDEGH